MSERVDFNYYYGTEAEQFTFYRIPKLLISDSYFSEISCEAKLLYGLMLDRMSLSSRNGWIDDKKRVYIYFSVDEIMEALHIGKNKALKTIAELDTESGIGLIERVKKGQGKTSIIYVKNFTRPFNKEKESDPEVYKLNFKEFDFQASRSPDIKLQEVYETNPNNNYINNKYISDNDNSKSNLIVSVDGRCDQMRYEDVIANNIDIDILIARNPHEKELLNGIYDLILETVLCANETVVIASNRYPASFVRGKFLKLKSDHIEYVMECFKGNTTKVKNIKKYLLAALFNAPTTISGYYTAEVNHDLCQPVTR